MIEEREEGKDVASLGGGPAWRHGLILRLNIEKTLVMVRLFRALVSVQRHRYLRFCCQSKHCCQKVEGPSIPGV